MIITRTPFRMSFFGGGTDIPSYFEAHEGAVLSTTFDRYCYVTVRPLPAFFEYSTELVYAKIERVTDIAAIEHPAIRNAMKMADVRDIRLSYEADLPARSGLGTSSSFAVGMLHAFNTMKQQKTDKRTLAEQAIYLERELCREAGGWQDQIAASYGGFNRINFSRDGFEVVQLKIDPARKEQLNQNLMLFFTGFSRLSSEIQEKNQVTAADKHAQLKQMYDLVDRAQSVLTDTQTDLDDFGRLLDVTWRLKRGTGAYISTDSIDAIYQKGMAAGALGGKLLGAGGGGFLLFYVQPQYQEAVKAALQPLLHIPFHFEEEGSRVVFYRKDSYEI